MQLEALTIPQLVRHAARQFGSHNAIEDDAVTLTFEGLAAACEEAARSCIASGVAPGDRIAIWAPNVHEWIVAAVGLQSVGAVLVPLNTRMKGSEAGYILEKSGARMLFTVGDFLGTDYSALLADALGGPGNDRPVAGLPKLEDIVVMRGAMTARGEDVGAATWKSFLDRGERLESADAQERAAAVRPDDLSDILFTSGTTGKPKGVMTTHSQNLRCFQSWSEIVGLTSEDRYLIVSPFFHSFGYKAGWLAALMRGATILPHRVFDVPEVLARIERDRVTVMPGAPTIYQSILVHPDREKFDLSSLRMAATGAAAIPVELIRRMRDDLGFETVVTAYGLTESSGVVTMCRPEDDAETIATTSGRAIPDVEVRCVDAKGTSVATGEPGEVVVRGYNVMEGYFEDAAATEETIDAAGWLHTGDVGVLDERGYLRITDRIKDMFIMGGFNCYPAEIENLLHGWEAVAHVAVVGVPDERMGEVGMAFVVEAPGGALDEASVIRWCRENMANYKVPRYVALVDELPMNATGKVTKFVLREWAAKALAAR